MGEPPGVSAWVLEEEAMIDRKGREKEGKGRRKKKWKGKRRATMSFFEFFLNLEKRTMV
jgi:hypothetical protein